MSMHIHVTGAEQVRRQLEHIGQHLGKTALAQTAVQVEEHIGQGASRHHKTGALWQSIYKQASADGQSWWIGHDAQRAAHARFVIFGTKPHLIRPKDKKALRWPAGGVFAFAKQVRHPGYQGDNYLQRAAAQAPQIFAQRVSHFLNHLDSRST